MLSSSDFIRFSVAIFPEMFLSRVYDKLLNNLGYQVVKKVVSKSFICFLGEHGRAAPPYGLWKHQKTSQKLLLTSCRPTWHTAYSLNFSPPQVTARIKAKMMIGGTLMMNYQPLGDRPNFFRSIISNQATNEDDIDYMLKEFQRLGEDM